MKKNKYLNEEFINQAEAYFNRKLYFIEHMKEYESVSNYLEQIEKNMMHISFINSFDSSFTTDNIEQHKNNITIIENKILGLKKLNANYMNEAKQIIEKKYSFIDILNGNKKKDKERLYEIGYIKKHGMLVDRNDYKGIVHENEHNIGEIEMNLYNYESLERVIKESNSYKDAISSYNLKYSYDTQKDYIISDEQISFYKQQVLEEKENFDIFVKEFNLDNLKDLITRDPHSSLLAFGYKWIEFNDGSGHLEDSKNNHYLQYDISTEEYKYMGENYWSIMTRDDIIQDSESGVYIISFEGFKKYAEKELVESILEKPELYLSELIDKPITQRIENASKKTEKINNSPIQSEKGAKINEPSK